MNYHEILGVQPGASTKEVQQAYRRAAKKIHPDHNNSSEADAAFQKLNEARDALLERANAFNGTEFSKNTATNSTSTNFSQPITNRPQMSAEEIAHKQELDREVAAKPKRSFFGRSKESNEIKQHRKKIKLNNRRMEGKY